MLCIKPVGRAKWIWVVVTVTAFHLMLLQIWHLPWARRMKRIFRPTSLHAHDEMVVRRSGDVDHARPGNHSQPKNYVFPLKRSNVAVSTAENLGPNKVSHVSIVKVLYWYQGMALHFNPDWRKEVFCSRAKVRFVEVHGDFKTPEGRQRALSEADIVVFQLDHPKNESAVVIPKKPRPTMVYIITSMESPVRRPWWHRMRSSPFIDGFNFLWSYNRNLSLHSSYMTMSKFDLSQMLRPPIVPFAKKLTSALMITLVTNCDNRFGRATLIRRLMLHIGLHNYGNCFRNQKPFRSASYETEVKLVAQYKFVLSVENSFCADYVTEKWIRGLRAGSIPVIASVKGFPNYTEFDPALHLPVYINTVDFGSPDDLANRMKKIGASEHLYSEYMAYRYLPRERLNPLFLELMDEMETDNRALCRLAGILTEDGRLNFTRASQKVARDNSHCLWAKVMDWL